LGGKLNSQVSNLDCETETLELLEWPRLCQHLSTFAATKLGSIAARHLTVPPNLEGSRQLLAQTQELSELECRHPTALSFEGIIDISASLERAGIQGMLTGEALLGIATTLAGMRRLRRLIGLEPDLTVLEDLVATLRTYPEIEQEIYHCLDDQGQVSERASPKLGEIRHQQRQLRGQIYQTLQGLLQRQASAIQEPLITQRGDRFVILVKGSHKDAIPGIVHDTSASGATFYLEPYAVVEVGNRLRQYNHQERVEVERILSQLTEKVAAVQPDLEQLLAIATRLDLALARARYSHWLGAHPPQWAEQENGGALQLRQLRHPLLIWQERHEQGQAVVPVDLVIPPHIQVITITGPNTGGKTVTLKTLGLALLMAKVGLYVPAQAPVELIWFDQILADIGDEQSLQQNLSTFSGHIRRISRILAALTPQSLVLLDEVGAGTDPAEGSALAIALLHYLAAHAQLTLATTHFGELKALKYQDNRFENAAVEFDDVSLAPTYRLLWGIPGRSNALTIARDLDLDANIITQAKVLLAPSASAEINQVIEGLEKQRREQEQKAQTAAQLLLQAEQLHQDIARKAADLKERERQLQQHQEQVIQGAIAQARQEIAQVIRQLQQGTATAQRAHQATTALEQIGGQYLPTKPKPSQLQTGFQPHVGDRVRLPQLGQVAEVIAGPDSTGELRVRFGLMKLTTTLAEIESLTGEKTQPAAPRPSPPSASSAPNLRTTQNTIDLRGQRVADAEVLLEEAIATTPGPLWIIHGHGTGRLRQGVQNFLKHHPQVNHFEPAAEADGGTGVTVAYCGY